MTSFEEAFGALLLLAAIALYWASAVNARDRARVHARDFCVARTGSCSTRP
jgi:hypothetical protein